MASPRSITLATWILGGAIIGDPFQLHGSSDISQHPTKTGGWQPEILYPQRTHEFAAGRQGQGLAAHFGDMDMSDGHYTDSFVTATFPKGVRKDNVLVDPRELIDQSVTVTARGVDRHYPAIAFAPRGSSLPQVAP